MKHYKIILFLCVLSPCIANGQNEFRSTLIRDAAQKRNMNIQETCIRLISDDLDRIQSETTYNQIDAEKSNEIQKAYVTEILNEFQKDTNWRFRRFDEGEYIPIRSKVITPIARLHFSSVPNQSQVTILESDQTIGETSTSKLFDSGTVLTFKFELSGYKQKSKKYKVMSYPKDQYLEVTLEKVN